MRRRIMTSALDRRRRTVRAALAVLLILGPSAAAAQTRPASPELASLVPKLAAWSPSEAPRSYFPDDLFEYINGAAESYLSYDFRELLVVDLEKKGTDATLTVEIYDMGLPLNAFGIFAAERYPDNKTVALGDQGYVEGEALNFLSGRYYVKMLGFGLGEATEAVLVEVGAKVDGAIQPKAGLPALVRAFPPENLVARSERYIKRNFMGYEFLNDGYVATYRSGGRELEGFFIDGGSEKAAEGLLAKLLDALAADNQAAEKIPAGHHVRNRYGQHLYIGRAGGILCGAMRVPDGLEAAGESLLDAAKAGLSKSRASR